jgi:anti-sigma factor RsiW
MTCEEIKPWFAEYWSGTLDREASATVEQHLQTCETCRADCERLGSLWRDLALLPADEPDRAVRERFYETLAAYREGAQAPAKSRSARVSPLLAKIAAGIALVAGGAAAGYGLRSNQASANEIAQLRGEVGNMRQLVTLSLLQQQSASERLRGVSWAVRAEPADIEVFDALLAAVNHDPNVNVRLAAVDALRNRTASVPSARNSVMQALPGQTEPIVQVALIDLLVDLKEKDAAQELQRVALDGSTDLGVREHAAWALEKLQ